MWLFVCYFADSKCEAWLCRVWNSLLKSALLACIAFASQMEITINLC